MKPHSIDLSCSQIHIIDALVDNLVMYLWLMPHIVLKNSSFYQKVLEWNKLDFNVCAYPSYCLFKTRLLGFIRIHRNSIFNFHVIMFKILH